MQRAIATPHWARPYPPHDRRIKNCRLVPAREVVEARLSQAKVQKPAGGGSVRMPDRRAFFATRRP